MVARIDFDRRGAVGDGEGGLQIVLHRRFLRIVIARLGNQIGRIGFRYQQVRAFYRLNVARLLLPPLRDRPGDIALLIAQLIAEFNARDAAAVAAPDPALLAALAAHDWPGNVRELRNVIEAVFIDPPAGRLEFEHLPPAVQALFGRYRRAAPSEKSRLVDALERTNWNKAEAAKALNWSRMTLYRKLAKYHVEDGGTGA